MKNVYSAKDAQEFIDRINKLTPSAVGKWGKMSVDQALAHLNVTYSYIFEPEKHKKPSVIAKFFLSKFVKNKVVGEKMYRQNLPTAPSFRILGKKDFEVEKKKLIGNIQRVQQLGEFAFEGKENLSFGPLSSKEWNALMAKHLDHHLLQFGV